MLNQSLIQVFKGTLVIYRKQLVYLIQLCDCFPCFTTVLYPLLPFSFSVPPSTAFKQSKNPKKKKKVVGQLFLLAQHPWSKFLDRTAWKLPGNTNFNQKLQKHIAFDAF